MKRINQLLCPIVVSLAIGYIAGYSFGITLGPEPKYTPEMKWKAGIVIDGDGKLYLKNIRTVLDGNYPAFTVTSHRIRIIDDNSSERTQ